VESLKATCFISSGCMDETLRNRIDVSCAVAVAVGEFHDQGDAKWKVIRRSLWGHNDTPCGQPAPGQPIGCLGSGRSQGILGGLSYY
jgi:hypothetical protein